MVTTYRCAKHNTSMKALTPYKMAQSTTVPHSNYRIEKKWPAPGGKAKRFTTV